MSLQRRVSCVQLTRNIKGLSHQDQLSTRIYLSTRQTCRGCPVFTGSQRWLKNWSTSHTRRGPESWDCSVWRREDSVGILPMCINTWWVGLKTTEPGSSQGRTVTQQEAMGTNWTTNRKLHLKVRKHLLIIFKTDWTQPWATCCNWGVEVDRWSLEVPSNPSYSVSGFTLFCG